MEYERIPPPNWVFRYDKMHRGWGVRFRAVPVLPDVASYPPHGKSRVGEYEYRLLRGYPVFEGRIYHKHSLPRSRKGTVGVRVEQGSPPLLKPASWVRPAVTAHQLPTFRPHPQLHGRLFCQVRLEQSSFARGGLCADLDQYIESSGTRPSTRFSPGYTRRVRVRLSGTCLCMSRGFRLPAPGFRRRSPGLPRPLLPGPCR